MLTEQALPEACDRHNYSSESYMHLLACRKDPQPWVLPDEDETAFSRLFSESSDPEKDSLELQALALQDDSLEAPVEDDPVPLSTKQDTAKPGFFDLPPEIRIDIYKHMCTTIHIAHAPAEHQAQEKAADMQASIPIKFASQTIHSKFNTHRSWRCYTKAFTGLQLLSHQFRAEFLPKWAECTTFTHELTLPTPQSLQHLPRSRRVLPYEIWTALRDFLAECNARYVGTGKCVHRFRVVGQLIDGTSYNDYKRHAKNLRLYARDAVAVLAHGFERLEANLAHVELCVEVVFVSSPCQLDSYATVAAKRDFQICQGAQPQDGDAGGGGARRREQDWGEWRCVRQGTTKVRARKSCGVHHDWTSAKWQTEAELEEEGLDPACPQLPEGFAHCKEWEACHTSHRCDLHGEWFTEKRQTGAELEMEAGEMLEPACPLLPEGFAHCIEWHQARTWCPVHIRWFTGKRQTEAKLQMEAGDRREPACLQLPEGFANCTEWERHHRWCHRHGRWAPKKWLTKAEVDREAEEGRGETCPRCQRGSCDADSCN
ncbi:hypothetical protein LTR08_001728 [Meristemomyces frigidus]|nr:hypothetical protein LTR08_001728 [Meristemomyces frigidus]